ncbi:MAG: hypothetical protein KW806_01880, partial [Candidatus Yanofskybacteria bacterium]|nr:hypothetical protein [Candidatus Yanofskybacteria bacterium]
GEYNGFKIVGEGSTLIGGDQLKNLYDQAEITEQGQGSVIEYDPMDDYIEKVVSVGGSSKIMLSVGCTEGSTLNKELLKKLGQKADLEIYDTPWETPLYVHYDPDGDRIWFTDSEMPVEADLLFLMVAEKSGFKKVVYDFRYSRIVRERFTDIGIEGVASTVGRTSMYDNMKKLDADMGGELSGHYYFREFSYLESPELFLLLLRNVIQQEGSNLSELLKPYRLYRQSGEINFPLDEKALSKLEEHYKHAKISKEDGLYVDLWDTEGWWFNVRPSHTEPVMRLYVEAKTDQLLQEKLQDVKNLL